MVFRARGSPSGMVRDVRGRAHDVRHVSLRVREPLVLLYRAV